MICGNCGKDLTGVLLAFVVSGVQDGRSWYLCSRECLAAWATVRAKTWGVQ